MDASERSYIGVIANVDMASDCGGVGNDHVVTNTAVVCNVRLREQRAVITNSGSFVVGTADADKLACGSPAYGSLPSENFLSDSVHRW